MSHRRVVRCVLFVAAVTGTLLPSTARATAQAAAQPTAQATSQDADKAGCQTVHLGPQLAPDAPASSYFRLTAAAGSIANEEVIVANPQPYECAVTILPAFGKTALNSGYTYPPVERDACNGASCWLSGLPTTVVVGPNQRLEVPFTVSVPSDITPGQYLAGVVGQPADAPPAPKPADASAQQGSVGASVITRVAIGVAIEVMGDLRPELSIRDVAVATTAGSADPQLNVVEADHGTTWEHPTGQVTIRFDGEARTFAIVSNTILPGDEATLSITVAGLPAGVHPAAVELWYADHHKVARWSGELAFPARAASTATTTPGAASSASTGSTESGVSGGSGGSTPPPQSTLDGSPPWGISALNELIALSLVLGCVVVFFVRRRRDRREERARTEK